MDPSIEVMALARKLESSRPPIGIAMDMVREVITGLGIPEKSKRAILLSFMAHGPGGERENLDELIMHLGNLAMKVTGHGVLRTAPERLVAFEEKLDEALRRLDEALRSF